MKLAFLILGVAQAVLLILKLTGIADCSWGWILIPFWMGLGIIYFLIVMASLLNWLLGRWSI